jgi:hypothetical protein
VANPVAWELPFLISAAAKISWGGVPANRNSSRTANRYRSIVDSRLHVRIANCRAFLQYSVNQEFPLRFSGKDIHSEWLPVTDSLEKPVDFPVLIERVIKLVEP